MAGVRRLSKAKAMAAESAQTHLRTTSGTQNGPGADDEHIFCGYLQKKGDDVRGAYRKRWFELSPRAIHYYESRPITIEQKGAKLKGQIQLQFVSAVSARKADPQCFKFDVVTPTRKFRLWAASRDEMQLWIDSIGEAVKRQRSTAAATQENLKAQQQKAAAPPPPPLATWERWTNEEVVAWLWTIGLQKYTTGFARAGIVGSQLKSISTGDLRHSCGVEDLADQIQIQSEVKRLLQDNLAFGTPMPTSGMGEDSTW